ncbi:MAG TPA: hypothetical protein VJ922_02050 [Actinomycetota bacterium]|nr:hypothetical protein [Actinomycetota bacterium]
MRSRITSALGAAVVALMLASCAEVSEAKHTTVEPYTKVETGDKGLYRVTLTESAIARLDVKTAPVVEARGRSGAIRRVIPYGGIIYDLDGKTFAYTSPEALVFLRQPVSIDYIDGDRVFLLSGPEVGTAVVVTGAAELYGIEFGLGK